MKFLFVHQNFPSQFLHIVRHLLKQQKHDIVFISEMATTAIPGVRNVFHQRPPPPHHSTKASAWDFAMAMARAEAVAGTAAKIKMLGFTPDIIIGHHGWGELLNLQDVWPGVPLLGYFEFYGATHGLDAGFDAEFPLSDAVRPVIRARNAVNLLALTNPGSGQTPTRFQLNTYPAWARHRIRLLQEGVCLDTFQPGRADDPLKIGDIVIQPSDRLVTFVSRDLEPYRGFHVVMRALPGILRARPDAIAVLVGGDGVSYGAPPAAGTWRQYMQAELRGKLDSSRVHFPGWLETDHYLRLLRRSDAHIYFTYPFVVSWSLREAMACGCALVCGDTAPVREFVTHGTTGLLTPFFDANALADRVIEVLQGGRKIAKMRAQARRWAEKNLAMNDYLEKYEALISSLTGSSVS
jgi:glycosyltransferase involved in cell wall biosynthesis